MTVTPSELIHLFDSVLLLLQEEIRQIPIYKTDKVDKDKDCPFSKDLHFKVLGNIQVMSDLVQCQIQGIILPTLDLDQLQDHFPDLDLEISMN